MSSAHLTPSRVHEVAVVVVRSGARGALARALIPLPTTLIAERASPPTTSTAKPLERTPCLAPSLGAGPDAWARNAAIWSADGARVRGGGARRRPPLLLRPPLHPVRGARFSAWRLLDGSGTFRARRPGADVAGRRRGFLGAEALFYVLRQGQIRAMSAQPTSSDPPVMSRDERLALWRRVLESALSAHGSVDGWVESWFLDDAAKPRDAELQRADVARFISRGVFGVSPMELTDSEALDLAKMLAMLERRLTKPLVGEHEPSPEIERLLSSSRADAAAASAQRRHGGGARAEERGDKRRRGGGAPVRRPGTCGEERARGGRRERVGARARA